MRDRIKRAISRHGDHARAMGDLLKDLAHRHRLHQVFADFCELSALAISNSCDKAQFEVREARYLQIVGRYTPEEVAVFPELLAHLVAWLERGHDDCLGKLFMQLELGNHWKGQFFTPYEISGLMARLTLGDVRAQVQAQGFITIQEPCIGAGAMVIAMADVIAEQGVNFQRSMHATCIDIDATAAHMAYVQLSLLGIPAIVIQGNSLSLEVREHWVTPLHVLHGWDLRLRARRAREAAAVAVAAPALAVYEVPSMPAQAQGEPDELQPGPAEAESPVIQIRQRVIAQRIEQLDLFG